MCHSSGKIITNLMFSLKLYIDSLMYLSKDYGSYPLKGHKNVEY